MAGRPAIYHSAAARQAAYRHRKAGATLALDEPTFEQTLERLRSLIREHELPEVIKSDLHAVVEAMNCREGYAAWKLERQRLHAWGRY